MYNFFFHAPITTIIYLKLYTDIIQKKNDVHTTLKKNVKETKLLGTDIKNFLFELFITNEKLFCTRR